MQAASVISSANSLWKLNSTSVTDLVGARSCYETAILDWQEEAHSLMDAGNGGEYETLRGEIGRFAEPQEEERERRRCSRQEGRHDAPSTPHDGAL